MRISPMSPASLGRVLLGGLAAGAALMYLLDPQHGEQRRAWVRDRTARTLRGLLAAGTAAGTGVRAAVCARVSDQFLMERVLAEVIRVVAHPASIQLNVRHGQVTLWGPVLRGEEAVLRRRLTALGGVRVLELQLTTREATGGWRLESRQLQERAS